MPAEVRPFGVTVLSVLQFIVGVLTLLAAFASLAVSFILPEMFPRLRYVAAGSALSGFGLLVLALVEFIVAFGLWIGRGWARILSLILAVVGIVIAVLSLFARPRVGDFFVLMLDLAILYYLIQPRIGSYFQPQTSQGMVR